MIYSRTNYLKFGEIAVSKKFVRTEDVEKALDIQKKLIQQDNHQLIGIIMLNEGMITNAQLIEILQYYDHHQE